jgi:hypothetical protein
MRIAERASCDVLVCGGGSAGLAAAIASARGGASTILLERHGFCGGICVSALVHTFDGVRNCRNYDQFVVGGVPMEVINELCKFNGLATEDNPPECLTFDPEALKSVADQMLRRAGVRMLYHLFAVGAIREGDGIRGVIAAGKEGLWEITARQVIDTTGDGDVSCFAGAPYEKDPQMQAMSQHFRIGGLKGDRSWRELESCCRKAMDDAYAAGLAPKYGGPWIIRIRPGEITLNCTRLYGDGARTEDLTRNEIEGRGDMFAVWNIFRNALPEFRDSFILASGVQIGVRETRRILGDYQITAGDIQAGRQFDDAIALGSWPIDIHPVDGRVGVHPHKENPPEPYQIPARVLMARGPVNLLVAGRCMSATHEAHGSTRVSGTAMAVGQAAGAFAAMAARESRTLRSVPVADLQNELLKQGAVLSLKE